MTTETERLKATRANSGDSSCYLPIEVREVPVPAQGYEGGALVIERWRP